MANDALAPSIARSSAAMVLGIQDKWVLVIHKQGFQLPVAFHSVWSNDMKSKNIFIPLPIKVNTLRLRQNGRHFAADIFKYNFVNENVWISLKISLKFVHKALINNIPGLIQMMAWCWPGDMPLSEPMMVSLLMNLCIAWPQWVKGVFWNHPVFD